MPDYNIFMNIYTITLMGGLALASAIDWQKQRLPDWVTLPLCGIGLFLNAAEGSDALVWSSAGAAAGYSALWLLRAIYRSAAGRDGIGLGDAKLLAAAGAWLGPLLLAPVLLVAATSGLIAVSIARIAGRIVTLETRIPFGPFLSLGFAVCWLAVCAGPVGR